MNKTAEELEYKLALDLAKKAANVLFDKVLVANGLSPTLGSPATQLISIYTKKAMEIFLAARKYDPSWELMRAASEEIRNIGREINVSIQNTPIPTIPKNGMMMLFGPLLDPQISKILKEEKEEIRITVEKVVSALDNYIIGTVSLMREVRDQIVKIDEFLEKDSPGNKFEQVYGQGSLSTERSTLCQLGQDLITISVSLIKHRNGWADIGQIK